jgi:hypothetical protein
LGQSFPQVYEVYRRRPRGVGITAWSPPRGVAGCNKMYVTRAWPPDVPYDSDAVTAPLHIVQVPARYRRLKDFGIRVEVLWHYYRIPRLSRPPDMQAPCCSDRAQDCIMVDQGVSWSSNHIVTPAPSVCTRERHPTTAILLSYGRIDKMDTTPSCSSTRWTRWI